MELKNTIWIEKYRPQKFSDIKGQEKIVERVEALVKLKNIPHMLFSGPAGVGKSTISLVIAKELYGEAWHQNFLELNGSDDRGIETIRGIIKDYARVKPMGDFPFKIILLDEADALTKDAQHALRRTMETYAQTTRFLLSCNFSSKIIDPILSRCTVFRFKPLEDKNIKEIIKNIEKTEKITVAEDAVKALINISEGDCRKLENTLQSCAAIDNNITEDLVYSLISAARPKEVKEILEIALKGDFLTAREKLLDTMLKYGLSGLDIIKQMQKEIWSLSIEDNKKIYLIDKCGDIEFRIVEGSDEFVQLESFLANVISVNK
ncbi:replication factor C small subunit [Candidatus Woesearchaeota archaeon]|nr:replication factor C small subunit [Candidatus Woesearchaeota archaeon]